MGRERAPTQERRQAESVAVVTIERVAAGGDGVGRVNGQAVFVPRTAPGDVVQVAYVSHGRHARGRLLQVLTPSPDRVAPPCMHYERDRCGGCQLQHLAPSAQQQARREIVRDTLTRIGRRPIALPSLMAGDAWRYRSRLSLTLRRRGRGWIGGFHPHDDPSRVFALETCHIAHPVLVEVWGSVRGVLREHASALPRLLRPDGRVTELDHLRLSLRLSDGDVTVPGADGVDVTAVQVVVEGGTSWAEHAAFGRALQEADPRVAGVWWQPDRQSGAQDAATPEYAPQAREALAFAQVNAGVAAQLREAVFAAVQGFAPQCVLDGYAGSGLLSARLAQAGVRVIAVEADAAGADLAAQRLAQGSGASAPSRVVCDLMERALAEQEIVADVVVLNPPRRGVHPDVTAWLEAPAQARVAGVVYVSCDPATLARDVSRLPSWQVASVQCFDMFPQTAHVETVCVLRRENP